MPSPLFTLRNWAHLKQTFKEQGLQFLTFSARPQVRCPASPIEQWAVTWNRLLHRVILFNLCSPSQHHAMLCQKWQITLLVLGFPFQNVSVTSLVCDECILKSLKAVWGWGIYVRLRIADIQKNFIIIIFNSKKSIRKRCLLLHSNISMLPGDLGWHGTLWNP